MNVLLALQHLLLRKCIWDANQNCNLLYTENMSTKKTKRPLTGACFTDMFQYIKNSLEVLVCTHQVVFLGSSNYWSTQVVPAPACRGFIHRLICRLIYLCQRPSNRTLYLCA